MYQRLNGTDYALRYALPLNTEMMGLAGNSCGFYITSRVLGLCADSYSRTLYQHLRRKLGLPDWRQVAYHPLTLRGARMVRRLRYGNGQYAAIIPFDGLELEVYPLNKGMIGSFYSFDLDYRMLARLLHGLSYPVLADLAYWFDQRAAGCSMTIVDYLRYITQ